MPCGARTVNALPISATRAVPRRSWSAMPLDSRNPCGMHWATWVISPCWPGRRIAFQDNHLRLYAIDLVTDAVSLVDASPRRLPFRVAFSPDGQWMAYTVVGENYFTRVRLRSFAASKCFDLPDAFVQTDTPVFGGNDLLYFTASIDAGPTRVFLDMSTQERPLRTAIYAAVLSADGRSPLPPKSGDEDAKDKDADKADKGDKSDKSDKDDKSGKSKKPDADDKMDKPVKPTRIDVATLSQRFVPIPVPERNYDRLAVGADGALFYLAKRQPGSTAEAPGPNGNASSDLYRFNFEDREEKLVKSRLVDFSASADGKKLLLTVGEGKLEVADANEKLESKPVDLSGVKMLVDPRQEWRQIFDETWRMEQQYFYDPNMHGLPWTAVRARYEPLLQFVQTREDLNELLVEMIGEMQVGHNRIGGGDVDNERPAGVGLLGA